MVQTGELRSGSTVEALTTSSRSSLASRGPLATHVVRDPLVVGSGSLRMFSLLIGLLREKLLMLRRGKLLL